jgi:cyclic beta-1,2-glucan synthetase
MNQIFAPEGIPYDSVRSDYALAGVSDALDLARAECVRHGEDDTASRPRLAAALDTLSTHLWTAGDRGPIDWAALKTLAQAAEKIAHGSPDGADADLLFWIGATRATIDSHVRDLEAGADGVTARLAALETTARALALDMDFAFLLDADRKLLAIGYSVADGVLDANCYDLLASEARLASYFAIAKGDVPARHWFRLGHAVTPVRGGPVLISWSGSMFEYLMPALIMRPPAGSLLERTECRIVTRQIEYGLQLRTPWGVSESAFNARDLELTYQYSNFGVPGLGLKRGLGDSCHRSAGWHCARPLSGGWRHGRYARRSSRCPPNGSIPHSRSKVIPA